MSSTRTSNPFQLSRRQQLIRRSLHVLSSMATKVKLNVHDFPRPPLLERTPRHLRIKWNGNEVLSSTNSYWALETTHPPTYYIPKADIASAYQLSQTPSKSSICEWKGRATYWDIKDLESDEIVKAKIWSYESPTPAFKDIKSYFSFYASDVPWQCFVDDEQVEPQPGDFYGGWKTSDIEGTMKGGPGTWGW